MAGLSAPARRAPEGAGLPTLQALAACSEAELLALHGMGPKSFALLKAALGTAGRSVGAARASRKKALLRKAGRGRTRRTGCDDTAAAGTCSG